MILIWTQDNPINHGLNLGVEYSSRWDDFHTTWKNVLWIENDPWLNTWVIHQTGTKERVQYPQCKAFCVKGAVFPGPHVIKM